MFMPRQTFTLPNFPKSCAYIEILTKVIPKLIINILVTL